MIKSAREMAWAKAQARGMSRGGVRQRWAEQVKQYRDSVEQKVVGVRSLANSLTNRRPRPRRRRPTRRPRTSARRPGCAGGPTLPPTVGSQYQANNTAGAYQGANDELWNRFDD